MASNLHFEGCDAMPDPIERDLVATQEEDCSGACGKRKRSLVTPDVAVTLYRTLITNGQSGSGGHTLEPEAAKQAKKLVHKYKREFGGDVGLPDIGMPINHTLREVRETFETKNLFKAWSDFAHPENGAPR